MGVIILFLGVVFAITFHVLTHRRMDTKKKKLYVVSLIFAIVCSFISTAGENKGDFLYFGVPAETFCLLWRMGNFVSSLRLFL